MLKEKIEGGILAVLMLAVMLFAGYMVVKDAPNQNQNFESNPISIIIPPSIHNAKPYFNIDFSQVKDYIPFNHSIEMGYCLIGHGVHNSTTGFSDYVIDGISAYLIGGNESLTSPTSGLTLNCSGDDLAMMHSHPNKNCNPSLADFEAWKFYAKKGIGMFLIQCGGNKVVAYLVNDYSTGYTYEVQA